MSEFEDEIVQEFLVESGEALDGLDASFVALESNPDDKNELSAVFRAMHTIKGTCGFLGFGNLENLAHKGENLLSMLRDGAMALDVELTDALLATVDLIRELLEEIADTGTDTGVETGALVTQLIALADKHDPNSTADDDQAPPQLAQADPEPEVEAEAEVEAEPGAEAEVEVEVEPVAEVEAEVEADVEAEPVADVGSPLLEPAPPESPLLNEPGVVVDELAAPAHPQHPAEAEDPTPEQPAAEEPAAEEAPEPEPPALPTPADSNSNSNSERIGDILVKEHDVHRLDVEIAAAEQSMGDDRKIGEILADQGVAKPDAVESAAKKQKSSGPKTDTTIRVDVALLDDLMNLVGELVLARNEILQHVGRSEDTDFAASSQRLNIITSDLQERVMKTRMQPIASLWSKLPRVVRDLSHQCGKQVRLEMEGKETELDKSLLEAIKDPITHIVRNTVDHGIEEPERRTEAGKPTEGVLKLSASHEGGQVNIEITDDGGGIDLKKIRAKAVEKGLVQARVAENMSDNDAVQLIFAPGFSTAAAVTNVSGRGVGMDVVRTNIEKIGGSVEVRTELGQGTTFKMKIPLTLAIVPALVITTHGRRYAIPQTGLVELLTIGTGEGRKIEFIHGTPVLRIRDQLLPIVDLRKVLKPETPDQWTGDVVILTADDQTFGVLVDDIIETQEIVVKPLGNVVADVRLFSGATILGDGKVALIVDVMGVAHDAGVLSALSDTGRHHQEMEEAHAASTEGETTLLLLRVGQQQLAMALEDVARLEEFSNDQVEWTGHRPVIQYRGTIMPLVDLGQELGYGSAESEKSVSVVVYSHHGRDVGLMIGEVVDIVEADVSDPSGCVVARGQVTDLIRPEEFHAIQAIEPVDNLMGVS